MAQEPADHDTEALNPSFRWLNWTQFQGALNDNIFKLLVTFFLIRNLGVDKASMLSGLGGIIFALPFILFIPAAGVLADRISKSRITVAAKIAEAGVMLVAVLVFWLGNPWMGFLVLFLMSTQSALFAPVKYGIIPELVKPHQLSRANGYLVSFTYLSIILGTVAGPWLTEAVIGPEVTDRRGDLFALAGLACVAVALGGILTSLRVERTPVTGVARKASWLFWENIVATLRAHRHDRFMMLAILASAYFSLISAFIQLNLIPFAIEHLGLSETAGGYLFLFAAFGIGAGSLLAGRCSGRNIEFGIIPAGALMIALSTMLMFILPYGVNTTRGLMFMAGVGAGLFIIPVEAFIQYRAPREQMGAIMAANGFLSWAGVLMAGVLVFALSFIPFWKPAHTFVLLGVVTLGMTVSCLKVLPDFFVRFVAMILTRSVYAIRRTGLEHLPREGGGLLVANHVAATDALLILSCQQRRIRFLMERSIYERHSLRAIFRLMGVIPVSERDNPKFLVAALRKAREEMDNGFLVCIFAEGTLTRTGQMRTFKAGFERILKGSDHPVIPVYLGGVWGSRFSRFRTFIQERRAPVRWRYPVEVIFGAPLPSTAKAWEVQSAVRTISSIAFDARRGPRRSVGAAYIRSARRHFRQPAIHDTTGRSLTHGKALIGALAIARLMRRLIPEGERHVGLVLPPSVGGALMNAGLVLAGKVPVNLNFTTSAATFDASLNQAEINTVITARKVVEKVTQLRWPEGLLFADDLKNQITGVDRMIALLQALLVPVRWLVPPMPEQGDDLLTIIFSSGTTGEPKGVMLTHHNILSNIEGLSEILRPDPSIHLCATLPIFHSFGFTAGIWFPLLGGFQASYHTSPLDTTQVIDLIRERRCNILFSTSTFLSSYARKAEPADLASLKYVVLGAEKMKRHVADYFEEKFGIRPLEGYGTTELSPVVSLNLPDTPPEDGLPGQTSRREGSIGLPLPGIAVTVVDLDTGDILPPGCEGMLMVHGPNVMKGYLKQSDLTHGVMRHGWYTTGDIARIDEDGFIFITDRLLRFSKIAGEMVPHMAAEEAIASKLKIVELSIAVTAVPDDRKGERLVLLYTEAAGDAALLKRLLDESNLPNLWCPPENCFLKIEKIPVTSTGKLDVRQIKQIACELLGLIQR